MGRARAQARPNVSQLIQHLVNFGFWILDFGLGSQSAIRNPQSAISKIVSYPWRSGVRPVTVTIPVTLPCIPQRLRERSLRRIVFGLVVCGLLFSGTAAARAAESGAEEHVTVKNVQGIVSAINRHGIAVEMSRTKSTSAEMYLPFFSSVRLGGVRKVEELHAGDTVFVEYREVVSKADQGAQATVKRAATAIALVARAPAATESPEPVEVAGSTP